MHFKEDFCMRTAFKTALIAVLCLLLCTAAAADGSVTVSAEFGYDGSITYLAAMPLKVTLQNNGEDADFTLSIDVSRAAAQYDTYEYPVTLAGGAEKEIVIPIILSYKQNSYTLQVKKGDAVVASQTIAPTKVLSPSTLLVGVLSDNAQNMSYLNINTANDQLMRGETWQTISLTAENFPETYEMMKAFSILAVDGIDVTTLSDAQQEALTTWIKKGGVVIVGGGTRAAAAYRGFTALTGITTGTPYSAENVAQALTDAMKDTKFPITSTADSAQGTSMLSPINGDGTQVAAMDGNTLIACTQVENGLIYTTAFSLSEKPLAGWDGMSCFWQRVLLATGATVYQSIIDGKTSYYVSERSYSADSTVLSLLEIDNESNILYPVAAIVLFLLLAGVGSYLILKRLDRREWMWLTIPVLACCCVGAVCLMSSRMQLNKPAVAAYSIYNVDSDGTTEGATMAGVAIAEDREITVSTEKGALIEPSSLYYSYYTYDDESTTTRTASLRYRFTLGENRSVTFPASGVWEVQTLYIEPDEKVNLDISASIWWEDDGLHGEIVNNSDYTLDAGYVLSMYGYCTTPRVLPGQTVEISITENPDRQEAGVYDGELINEKLNGRGMMYIDTIIYTALHPNDPKATYDDPYPADMSQAERTKIQIKSGLISAARDTWYNDTNSYYYNAKNIFRYVTFNEEMETATLTVNGVKADRVAHRAVIDVEMKYNPVSASGEVKVPSGTIMYTQGATDEKQKPYSLGTKGSDYIILRNEPVLCFDLSEAEGIDIADLTLTGLTLDGETYGATVVFRIYNNDTESWDLINSSAFPITITGDNLNCYMDADGKVFLNVSQQGSTEGELYNLLLSFEGKVK
jgi:hypothetical protein